MPRKPQPLSGRAARCALRRLTRSLRSLVRWLSAYVAGRPAQRLPLSVPPRSGSRASLAAAAGWSRRGCGGAREQRVRGRPAPRRCGSGAGRGWGGPRLAVAGRCCRGRCCGPGGLKGRRPLAPEGSRSDGPYPRRAVLRAADMPRSDRELPRAFWVFAVLSRASPYHLSNPAQNERPSVFWVFAVMTSAAASAPINISYK